MAADCLVHAGLWGFASGNKIFFLGLLRCGLDGQAAACLVIAPTDVDATNRKVVYIDKAPYQSRRCPSLLPLYMPPPGRQGGKNILF
ncbi:MAG: hypothetical protein K6U74_05905 [Firmicutes bacterium]|nr:hypothetical protein [Bacillota bacterium]